MHYINKYEHVCVVRSGPEKGGTHTVTVPWYELRATCSECGEELASQTQILEHIYMELTDGW